MACLRKAYWRTKYVHNERNFWWKKVFIVHSSDDFPIVEKYFIDVIEKELGALCVYDGRDFTAGKSTIANITDAVNKCHKTFVILTRGSVERQWVKYETLLALEKSQSSRKLCLTIFLFNMKQEEVKGQTFGVLSNALTVLIDTNKENWEVKLAAQMSYKLNEVRDMGSIKVAANLSVGQVWSHFTGYSRIVLPELADKIKKSKWYHPDWFPVVEFNLIPYSATTVHSLSVLDDRIKHEGTLDPITASRGSFRDRQYKCAVYSIQDDEGQKYYFTGLCPNTLSILQKLEADSNKWLRQDASGMLDKPKLQISAGERSLQVARFYFAFNRLLNHPRNKDCNNMASLVVFDDSQMKLKAGDVLLKAIKYELEKRRTEVESRQPDFVVENPVKDEMNGMEMGRNKRAMPADSHRVKKMKGDDSAKDVAVSQVEGKELEDRFRQLEIDRAVNRVKHKDKFHRRVYIDYLQECPEDVKTANDLKKFLTDHEFIVWPEIPPGTSYLDALEEAMKECQWAIFIVSSFSINSPECRFLQFRCRAVLHSCVEQNCVRVIPILENLNEQKIIDDLRPVTYLSKDEPRYKEKLLQILSCGRIPMESTITASDVHQGLAWAYVFNYLRFTLPEHVKKLQELKDELEQKHMYKVYTKMFIIVPSSCATRSLKSLDKDDQGYLIDTRFRQMKEIFFTVTTSTDRQYQLITYEIQTSTQTYVVAVEYPNAVLCLQEMSELQYLSGLDKDKLHLEAWRFKEVAQQVIDASDIHDKAKLLYYDDDRITVVDAMLMVLQDEEL